MLDTDWSLVDFTDKTAGAAKSAPVVIRDAYGKRLRSECPKCGCALGRGGHFHVKHCKGVSDDA